MPVQGTAWGDDELRSQSDRDAYLALSDEAKQRQQAIQNAGPALQQAFANTPKEPPPGTDKKTADEITAAAMDGGTKRAALQRRINVALQEAIKAENSGLDSAKDSANTWRKIATILTEKMQAIPENQPSAIAAGQAATTQPMPAPAMMPSDDRMNQGQ